jgi:hypothetical protein
VIFPVTAFKDKWRCQSRRPFFQLVKLFLERAFQGSGDSESEELDFSTGLVLSLLALPGALYSVLLFDKYGSLLQWMVGHKHLDVLSLALPDEYFLISLSMVVTGVAAVWRWDSIFPDRRDYANLVPLPISTRTIFFANLTAIFLVAGVLAVDVNLVSAFLFPVVATGSQETFSFFLRFAVVHWIAVILSSLFSFLAVFGVVGFLMSVLPYRRFRQISLYLRGFMIAYLVGVLSTSFAVPALVERLPESPIRFLPPVWFLGFCQTMRGVASPVLTALGNIGLISLGCLGSGALAAYAISYRRCFKRIPENLDVIASNERPISSRVFVWLDRTILRTPVQRAGYRFVLKTLFRSERHGLVLGGFVGLGIVLSSQYLFAAFNNRNFPESASPAILAVPLILSYCVVVGVRFTFAIPTELRSNWIFKLLLDRFKPESVPLARTVLLTFVFPWIFAGIVPFHGYLGGWIHAGLHALVVMVWAALLADILLIHFRKIPFTCSYPPFRDSAILLVVCYFLGFFAYVVLTAQFESWALLSPPRLLLMLPVALGIWYGVSRLRGEQIDIDKELIFEEKTTRGFEVLDLQT